MCSHRGKYMSITADLLATKIINEAKHLIAKLNSNGIVIPENERAPLDLIESEVQTISPKKSSNGIIWSLSVFKEGFDPSFVISHEDYDDIELTLPSPTITIDEHNQVSEVRYHLTDQYVQSIELNLSKIEFFTHQFIGGNFQIPLDFNCFEKLEGKVTLCEANIPQFGLNTSYMFTDGKCVLNVVFPDDGNDTPRLSLPFDENIKPFA